MTNEEAKQEAIKKAYGNKWDYLKEFCDSDGWITNKWVAHGVTKGISYEDAGFAFDVVSFKQFNSSDNSWRLKSIYSILNNNGWIRIEPDGSNLPTDGNKYDVIVNGKKFRNPAFVVDNRWLYEADGNLWEITYLVTHYKPITPEELPVY